MTLISSYTTITREQCNREPVAKGAIETKKLRETWPLAHPRLRNLNSILHKIDLYGQPQASGKMNVMLELIPKISVEILTQHLLNVRDIGLVNNRTAWTPSDFFSCDVVMSSPNDKR